MPYYVLPLQAEILSNLSITLRSTKLSSTARTCNSWEEEEVEEDKSPTAIVLSCETESRMKKRDVRYITSKDTNINVREDDELHK